MLFDQALSLYRQGNAESAERLYRQIVATSPGDFRAQHMLALALYQQQRFPEALSAVDAALELRSDATDTHMLRAVLLSGMGRYADALDEFARVTALQPGRPEAWYRSSKILSVLGRFSEAASALDRALAIMPTADGWNAHGVALQETGRILEALASYETAIGLNHSQPVFHANRARALQALERLGDAVAAYDIALTLRPEDVTSTHNRAVALLELKRYDDALAGSDQVLALAPGHVGAWKTRAAAARNLRRHEEALAGYDRAIALDSGDAEAWVGRALVMQTLQRLEEAFAALDRAEQLQPNYMPAISARGALFCEQGHFAEGFAAHRRYADLRRIGKPTRTRDDPPQKQRHDREQDAWRTDQGLVTDALYHILGGDRLTGAAVNPDNSVEISAQWKSRKPQIVVVDNLLTAEALEGLRRFCLGSTIWLRSYKNGYLGAMLEHGFACPLLAQIAEEMQSTFPDILAGHGLIMAWGFSYDSRLGGIRTHADQAAVNINFWLTPDDANNNPERGGLVIWDKAAPLDWDSRKYNGDDDAARTFLKETGAQPVTVPYRANRAVIFDSDLFHETDLIDFKNGFLNRRINVTILFGRRTFHGT
jgi:tetratricopeptide (TPR) repeat protein